MRPVIMSGTRRRVGGVLATMLLAGTVHAQTYTKTETIEYSDNTTLWVLGQVSRTTTNGVEVARTAYDSARALPTASYSFGKLRQSATYNADGTLATLKDGNGNLTSWGNYKRGIPQLIRFPATPDQPAGTSMTAVVDDLGQIRSITDAKGAKTCYDYDAMGRVQRIQYPSETSPGQCGGSWNDTVMSFQSGYPAAFGLPAGHWRQRVTTGHQVTETFYDGFWQPLVQQTYDDTKVSATLSQTAMRYDATGRKVFASYPVNDLASYATVNSGTHTSYDALDRVTKVQQDSELGTLTSTMAYLSAFKTAVTDPKGNVTTTGYMTFDQPSTDWPVSVAAPEQVTQTIVRDAFGGPQTITQSTVTKSFVYDTPIDCAAPPSRKVAAPCWPTTKRTTWCGALPGSPLRASVVVRSRSPPRPELPAPTTP